MTESLFGQILTAIIPHFLLGASEVLLLPVLADLVQLEGLSGHLRVEVGCSGTDRWRVGREGFRSKVIVCRF